LGVGCTARVIIVSSVRLEKQKRYGDSRRRPLFKSGALLFWLSYLLLLVLGAALVISAMNWGSARSAPRWSGGADAWCRPVQARQAISAQRAVL